MNQATENTSRMEEWAQWKKVNSYKLVHPAGFEEKFVDLVLRRIPGINPQDVIPQFSFKDDQGKNRRIDFVILNKDKGYLLPIELDGASKDDVRAKWTDFLERQNALIGSFGTVLRYSNAKMFNNPDAIIREISEHLAVQAAARVASNQRQAVLLDFLKSAEQSPPPVGPQPLSERKVARAKQPRAAILIGVACAAALGAAAYMAFMHFAPNGAPVSEVETMPPENAITPHQAAAYVGEIQLVCGTVAQTSRVAAGHRFINFERAYPNQVMAAVIWHNNAQAVGDVLLPDGSEVCVHGLIEEYNGRPSINITSRDQLIG